MKVSMESRLLLPLRFVDPEIDYKIGNIVKYEVLTYIYGYFKLFPNILGLGAVCAPHLSTVI